MDEDKVQRRRRQSDEQSTEQRAAILGFEYRDARDFEDTIELVDEVLSIEEMYQGFIVPLKKGNELNPYEFAITSQTPQSLVRTVTDQYAEYGLSTQFYMISQSGFRALMLRYDPPKEVEYEDITVSKEGDSETLASVSQTLNSVSSDRLFDYLITQADRLGASDIHIENAREVIHVRMRIDGMLHHVAELEKDRYRVVMSELASRAGVSTAAADSQSGHMQQEIAGESGVHVLNMRVETVPTMYGQDAVIRLFNFDSSLLHLDMLGIGKRERKEIDDIVSRPRGMVLMVGPTGSGKSTTLYSMLNALNTPSRKLIALEDPIEYSLDGVSQIPIDTTGGKSFADGLRSVLRLDPDVVMIGEIRDQDTARTAIQASITGHLVMSSFHANSTSAAFSRIIDMIGINPIFSSAIRLLIAQRLVRRLVDETKEAYVPDEATKQYVQRVLKDLPDSVEGPDLENFKLYKPVATEEYPFGYSGRTVIMEQMVVSEEVQKFIRGDVADARAEDIEAVAKRNGMITLEQAGVLAALRGETTLEEVTRVV